MEGTSRDSCQPEVAVQRRRWRSNMVHNGKVVIAVDLDEVLCPFVEQLCNFYNANAALYDFAVPTTLQLQDFKSYRFCEVWGGSDAQSLEIVHAFFDSWYFKEIPVLPDAVVGINALKEAGFDVVLVTSRQLILEEHTKTWIQQNFPNSFREIAFGNHWGTAGRKVSKSELCEKLGADVLIDDNISYAKECANTGMSVLLFGEYPWNSNEHDNTTLPSIVRRVSGWGEVVSKILELFPSYGDDKE